MKESRLQQMLRSRAYHRKWVVVFLVLALMVTAGVSAVLHKTGVAAVYTKRVLHCPYAELSGQVSHIHATDCYDADGNLVCPLQEIAPHTHTEECYTVLRDLVCGQEENPGHIHDDSCYTMTRGELLCTDESPDHEHT
ncbi:MAG: hypothetical protein J5949_00650, partial [Oscillospiraceae bacterium]|nr:hypothetical protein [Oscillospiraceae bacterium]